MREQVTIENIRLLLLDDQPSYLELVRLVLEDIGVQHFRLAKNYAEALSAFDTFKPDACFLDIELDHAEKNGVDAAHAIRKLDEDIPIVFLTSHFQEDFYEQTRPVRPSGFLNKEISRLKLLQLIELVLLQIENAQYKREHLNRDQGTEAPAPRAPYFSSSQFFFKIGDVYKAIDLGTIDFFYAENKLTYARIGKRNYPTNVQLKVLENELGPKFIRAHKKFLVNVDAIESIIIKDSKVKIGKELLPIGYTYRKSFLDGLNLMK